MGKATANKQVSRLFEAICYLNEGGEDKFVIENSKGKHKFAPKQVQAFVKKQIHENIISAYNTHNFTDGSKKAIQAFTGTTDIEAITTNVWNAFQETPNFDMLWQMAFRGVPLRKGQLEWSVGNVSSGTVFKMLAEGEKVEYAGISGSEIKGKVYLYGSGLEIDWATLEGRDLAGFYNAMSDFRAKRMSEYADVHYALLAAAAANNAVAWQGSTDDSDIDRDISTLNEGYNTIGENCKDLGFGDVANARMLIYAAPRLRSRINAALRATAADLVRAGGAGASLVDTNIEPLYTYNGSIDSNKAILVLPGNKIQNSVYMAEKTFERTNPDNLSMLKSSFTAFGGIVGENAQTAELSFA